MDTRRSRWLRRGLLPTLCGPVKLDQAQPRDEAGVSGWAGSLGFWTRVISPRAIQPRQPRQPWSLCPAAALLPEVGFRYDRWR